MYRDYCQNGMQVLKQVKAMKMSSLIVSLMLVSSCQCTVEDIIKIDNYKFYSLHEWGNEIQKPEDVDVVANIRGSKRIKGPVKGSDVKTLRLINKEEHGDTLKVIIYGKNNMYFQIGNEFFQAEKSILSK